MFIYYLLLFWIGFISLFTIDIKNKEYRNKIVVFLGCLAIFLIQALRSSSVGIDLSSYLIGYDIVDSINIFAGERVFNFEIGYLFFSQLFSKLNFLEQWFLAIVALLIIILMAYTWIRNSKMPGLSLFIYISLGFFTFSFSGLRQTIALAIVFFSYKYIQEKSLVKFISCVLLAMSFHTSAIIFIIAYPLYYLRIKINHLFYIVPLFLITFIFKEQIFLLIYKLYRNDYEIVSTNAYTMLLVMILVWVLSLVFGDKNENNLNFNAYKNYLLIAIFIQIFASQSNVAMRAGYYFYLFITLLIPEVIKHQKEIKMRMLASGVLIVALLYFFQTTTGSGYLNVYPYSFYWE